MARRAFEDETSRCLPWPSGSRAAASGFWATRYLDILRLEGGDELIVLVDVGCPPVANRLEQPAERAVAVGVAAEPEADPVAARLDLDALAAPALRPGERPGEPFRARGAELDNQQPRQQNKLLLDDRR